MDAETPRSRTDAGDCPTTSLLSSFAIGNLAGAHLDEIAGHVESCAKCARALDVLDGHYDDLVDDLRRLRRIGDEAESDVPGDLIVAARALITSSACDPGEVTIDPGRKIAHSLAAGPHRLGKFELLEELGAGSFGYVFKALDTELDRTVAIKLQRAGPQERGLDRDRFLREARSAAQLDHPGIVSLYETGETEEGVAYLVTEFIDGVTLEARMKDGQMDFKVAARLVGEVGLALDHAHSHGVVHRDIKPSNVMLDGAGRPHVMDFGLAKREVGEVTMTPDGAILGTPAYMSPEVARGNAHLADGRTDVYSLGVILYELLTGERPFQGIRRMLVLQVLEEDPRPPRRLNDKIPRDLETICQRAMEKAPARRYATAGDLAVDLECYRRGDPIRARALSGPERLWRWCRRNPIAAGLFVAIVLGSAFGFWHLSRLSRELVERSAVESAAQYSEMLEIVNELYTSEVVMRAGHHGVEATADYASHEGKIPLPATLLTMLLERISESESGMRGRHYSEYPFRTRTDGGPQNEFEWEALRHLKAQPRVPFKRIAEYEGRPALLYATARIMQASCVECHNEHPDSTKRDWRTGDVRGVLEIIRPLDSDVERTRAGLRSSFVLVGVVSLVLLLVSVAILILGDRRRRASRPAPLEDAA